MGYWTKWRGDRYLYYRYAPPPSPSDLYDEKTTRRPKRPRDDYERYERSVYYFWWAYLRENEGYMECCDHGGAGPFAKLYRDFGDIRDHDFMRWWDGKGRFLFCEPLERMVRAHQPDQSGVLAIERATGHLVVSFPVDGNLDRIMDEIRQLVGRERADVTLETNWAQARYPVATKPVLSSLHTHLRIWRLRRDNPDVTLDRIAELSELTFTPKTDNPEQRSIIVRRYIRKAQSAIEYVGRGIFPVLDPKKLKAAHSTAGLISLSRPRVLQARR